MIRKGIIITKDGMRILGGQGSGNFGHAGIPGQQGGSAHGGGGGSEGNGGSRSGSSLKPPDDEEFDHKEAVGGLNKYFSPKNNSSIEIADIYNETAGTNLRFEQIQEAQKEFSKGIRSIKNNPEELMIHVEDLVTASDNKVTERIVASEFAHMYANRRGVNLKIDNKSVVGGTVPRSVFDPLWKK